jgi:DNA (cytosine-5)-methyltransferase 1
VVVPAAAVNAPHGRDRVWFVARRVTADADFNGGTPQNTRSRIKKNRGANDGESEFGGIAAERIDGFFGLEQPIANTDGDGFNQRNGGNEINPSQGGFHALGDAHASDGDGNAADANRERPSIRKLKTKIPRDVVATNSSKFERTSWETFPTKPPVCGGNDGLPDQLDGITFSKWRHESLKAYGNAIVPQVAFEIFKVIQKIENGETL